MKKHIKLILRTLISNNACVEAARTQEKKYNIIAIIFALFALFFAALPTCVTGFKQNGGNFIRGVTYGFDTAMIDFGKTTKDQVTFEITKEHKLNCSGWKEHIEKYPNQDDSELYTFISKNDDPAKEDDHKLLEIYVCPADYDFNLYVEEIAKNINPLKVTKENKDEDEKNEGAWLEGKDGENRKNRSTSFIIFGETQIQAALYMPGNVNGANAIYGDYGNTEPTDNLIPQLFEDNNPTKTLEKCQTFFDQVYVNPRRANTWKSTGIILGVDAGVIILMGFMVWVLTRGKNNPFRIYSFWDGQKIAYYACLTPGIISLFGFLMSNMAMMLFILGVGVRVMWLSMRTLRYQAPAKQ